MYVLHLKYCQLCLLVDTGEYSISADMVTDRVVVASMQYTLLLLWLQNVVVVVTSMIAWLIPDIPTILKEQIRREAYITNEIILRTELQRAQGIDIGNVDVTASVERIADVEDSYHYSPQHSDIEMEVRHRPGGGEGDREVEEKTYI